MSAAAHAFNLSYSRRRLGELEFRASLGKSSEGPSQPIKSWEWWCACVCHPSYIESINRRINIQTCLGINASLWLEN
jgi:hypothetical protein